MGKHYDLQEKKINKKKLLLLILIIMAVITLIFLINKKNKNEKEIVNIINSTFLSLKNNNIEDINKYIDYNLLITGLDDMIIEENKTEIEKELFDNISWNIENIEINNNKAIVIIEVTNKDYKEILTKWMKEIVNEKNKGKNITNDIALNKLHKIIESETKMKTVIKKIGFERIDNKWKLDLDNSFIDLVYPGIDSVTEALKI